MSSPPPSGGTARTNPAWFFLIDENMPRPLAPALRAAGYATEDVRDVVLRGHPDPDIWAYAQAHSTTIITYDKDFGDILRYPKPHAGVVVCDRIDQLVPSTQIQLVLDALTRLAGQSFADTLVIIAPGRIRIHR